MKVWASVALATLAIVGLPQGLSGQRHMSVGSRPHSPTGRPRTGPSRPLPPSTNRPFRPAITIQPAPVVPGHRLVPFRSPLFGLILFDPFWWWTPGVVDETVMLPAPALSLNPRPMGGLQLDVEPRRALVYVDGLYVGIVDDFSGYYRHLDIGAGLHFIEMIAPDYDPLAAEVTVSAGRTTTYRASLNRAPGRH